MEGKDIPTSIADEWRAGFLSRVTFDWVRPLIMLGAERPLEHSDLGELPPGERVEQHLRTFEECRQNSLAGAPSDKSTNHTFVALRTGFWRWMVAGTLCKLFGDACAFVPPLALKWIIEFAEDRDGPMSDTVLSIPLVYWVLILLVVAGCLQGLSYHWFYHHVMIDGLHARTAMQASVSSARVPGCQVRLRLNTAITSPTDICARLYQVLSILGQAVPTVCIPAQFVSEQNEDIPCLSSPQTCLFTNTSNKEIVQNCTWPYRFVPACWSYCILALTNLTGAEP